MKTRILLIILLTASAVLAATLTIDIPANDVPRVAEAFGSILGLGRDATITEVQEATRRWIIQTTQDYERRKNTYTYTPPPMAMQPSPTPGGLQAVAPETKAAAAATPKPTATPKKGWW